VASCKSCLAEIEWAVTEAGKAMPVDVGEAPGGNLAVGYPSGRSRGAFRVRVLVGCEEPQPGERRTVSHYATCPHSAEWRARKKEAGRG
jgi:hypothetical protein